MPARRRVAGVIAAAPDHDQSACCGCTFWQRTLDHTTWALLRLLVLQDDSLSLDKAAV